MSNLSGNALVVYRPTAWANLEPEQPVTHDSGEVDPRLDWRHSLMEPLVTMEGVGPAAVTEELPLTDLAETQELTYA
jgi:hypothetical protein